MSIKVENIDGKNWKILEEIKYKNILVPKRFCHRFCIYSESIKNNVQILNTLFKSKCNS